MNHSNPDDDLAETWWAMKVFSVFCFGLFLVYSAGVLLSGKVEYAEPSGGDMVVAKTAGVAGW